MNKANFVRNLEICERHFGKEALSYRKLSSLYGVTKERIILICQKRERWEEMVREANEIEEKKRG